MSVRPNLERSADRFAILESRMQRPAHSSGTSSTPTDFSIGFGRTELSNPAVEDVSSSSPCGSSGGTPNGAFSASPSASAADGTLSGKRKRPPTPDAAPVPDPIGPALQNAAGQAMDSTDAVQAGKRPVAGSEHGRKIQNYFLPRGSAASKAAPAISSVDHAGASTASTSATAVLSQQAPPTPPPADSASSADLIAVQTQLAEARMKVAERTQLLTQSEATLEAGRAALAREEETSGKLRNELEQARLETEACKSMIAGMRTEVADIRTEQEAEAERAQRGREALRSALRERCFRSRAEAKERLARESVRLGHLEPESRAFSPGVVQKEGSALRQVHERERALEARKVALEEDRKVLRKRRAGSKGAASSASSGQESSGGPGSGADAVLLEACELADLEESLALRASLISRERAELVSEKRQLEREATEHFHELKLMQELEALESVSVAEGRVDLRDCPSLPFDASGCVHEPGAPPSATTSAQHRFVILDLIAQGGFSAVFKAYDLQKHVYTACKLHHISQEWGEERKKAFVRHVEREIDITVGVQHRRIVETYAVFEINSSTFVSVMPHCNGGSLQEMLRKHGPLPEKDAKSIMLQMLYGLLHLHSRCEPIIHYDLKPANILFHDGEVKLSDFGLSKVMSAPGSTSGGGAARHGMELTSYGSGTHGYLPPECYDGDGISRVCPKVDVFSAGVVHYLMLFYPQKPFFKHASQQQILQMKPHLIRQETQQLDFPGKISAEAQAFLRRALAPNRDERADVSELLADAYLQQKVKGGTT